MDSFDPAVIMSELQGLAGTMEQIDTARRSGLPCDPSAWPCEPLRSAALAAMPGQDQAASWAAGEVDEGWEERLALEGAFSPPARGEQVFSLEAALAASAAKQQQKKQRKRKKKS